VARQYDRTYYGFQAQNRRLELDERANAQRLSGLSPCLGEAEGQRHPDEGEMAFLQLVDEDELCLGAGLPSADPGAQRAARIHWRGPDAPPSPEQGAGYAGASPLKADSQHRMSAYHEGDQPLQGAARRAWASYGEAWPLLAQAAFLYDIGLDEPARQAIREAGLEFEGLSSAFKRGRPSAALGVAELAALERRVGRGLEVLLAALAAQELPIERGALLGAATPRLDALLGGQRGLLGRSGAGSAEHRQEPDAGQRPTRVRERSGP
jgi:hypothetical protein